MQNEFSPSRSPQKNVQEKKNSFKFCIVKNGHISCFSFFIFDGFQLDCQLVNIICNLYDLKQENHWKADILNSSEMIKKVGHSIK